MMAEKTSSIAKKTKDVGDVETRKMISLDDLVCARNGKILHVKVVLDEVEELGKQIQAKGKESGLDIGVDNSTLEKVLRTYLPAETKAVPSKNDSKAGQRPFKYSLKWASGEQIVDKDGNPFLFRSKVSMLRSPVYQESIGEELENARLVDTATGEVVVESLKFGPTPGRPAKA